MKQVSAEAFGGQLGKIVPRLYRYRFDPSAKTRAAMDQLWRSVVGGNGDGGDFSAREKEVRRWCVCACVCVHMFGGMCADRWVRSWGRDGRGAGAQRRQRITRTRWRG